MIDPDIRHIIEPELMPGEELLWAEKTCSRSREKFMQQQIKMSKLVSPIALSFSIVCLTYQPVNWFMVMLYGLPSLVMVNAWIVPEKYKSWTVRKITFSGFALTNERLIRLDDTMKFANIYDATKISMVKQTLESWLKITPVKSGIIKSAALPFLKNAYTSQQHLVRVLSKAHGSKISQ